MALMALTYFILLFVMLSIILLLRYFLLRRKNIPVELFSVALRNENKGEFEAAIISYENALNEAKKARFPSNRLKNKITEKLRILKTVTNYQSGFHYQA
jgi:hypothetical protein